ncbi:hypothetical protein IFM89_004249 [Coptis chinensis]|uniref:Uncharacterized protein n=1 Tax=Coptis chinensis TaxID=261450 RepID=A0A835I922_9MAGN|nr:hypothetical protein IFM89_004249 [Coptis chinensis]
MNWYSKLHKERSCDCACLAMDIGNWWNSGRRSFRVNQRYMESEFDELAASNFSIAESSKPRWRLFWRKFKKEKKRLFFSPVPVQVPYDPYTYSQNFDQGIAWTEPDNLPRSFSARYADPSRLFQRNISVGCGDPNIMFLTLLNGSHIPTVIGGVGGAPQLWIEGTIDVKLGDLTKHKVAMSEAPPQLALMYENTKLLAPGRPLAAKKILSYQISSPTNVKNTCIIDLNVPEGSSILNLAIERNSISCIGHESKSKTVTTNIPFDEDAAKMSKALSNSDKVDMIKGPHQKCLAFAFADELFANIGVSIGFEVNRFLGYLKRGMWHV